MPSSTPEQASFMRAIVHGFKPDRIKNPPSKAVAHKFMKADMAKARGKTIYA